MKRKLLSAELVPEEDTPKVDISSLVDVSFLLLIYFLVTSTLVKKEQDLDMRLPTRGLGSIEPLVVQLADDGKIVANPTGTPELISPAGGSSELARLTDRLDLLRAGGGVDAAVVLQVSEKVDYQRFIDVINCFAASEIDKLSLVDMPAY